MVKKRRPSVVRGANIFEDIAIWIKTMDLKNLVFAVITLAIVVVAIFMPELFTVKEGQREISSREVQMPEKEAQGPKASLGIKSDLSPLDKVLISLKQPRKKAARQDHTKQGLPEEAKPATWEMILHGKYRDVLISARNRAYIIADNLSVNDLRSRYALFDFANSINFVLSGPQRILSAPEALAYLEAQRLKVTRAFEEDGVGRKLMRSWRTVALDATRALDRMRAKGDFGISGRYRFSIVLTKVKLNKRSGAVTVRGLIKGENIERVELFRNGIMLQEVLKGKPRRRGKYMKFHFKYPKGTGVYALRVVDKEGSFYERRFRFFGAKKSWALNQALPMREVKWVRF
ncbi:MAG: hypothetical protein D6808_05305 [Candidatus Dadabacteria bacterium]|nr:MAG: hypothetical protein D6808_05305 [Candidatus Dadabacteria bacterium]